VLSLGIIASSFRTAGGLATFATAGTVPGTVNSLAFVNGTGVVDQAGTGSRYSTDAFTSTTLGGATIDTPNLSWGANGVVLKTGRDTGGTVTIARTSDGGQTWATALNVTRSPDRIETVAYADVSGTARWIAPVHNDNDVYLSTDNGASFAEQSNVLGGTARTWIAATRMGSAFAVFNAAVTAYYTSEIGTSWTLRTLPATPSSSDGRAFASSADTTMFMSAGSVVYTTSDLVSWTLVGTVPVGNFSWDTPTTLAHGNGNWVLALGDTAGANERIGVWYSSNNGSSWAESTVQGSASASQVEDIAFNDADNGFYIIGSRAGVNRVYRGLS
jgi:hypothetical protein